MTLRAAGAILAGTAAGFARKQQIVQNIVAYAHPRNMQIIAEGVELSLIHI